MVPTITLASGRTLPQLGFGTWKVGRAGIETALEAGWRSFDTAPAYGNEADLGAALAASGLPREAFHLATKVANDSQGYSATLEGFERSRTDLGVESLDLYLIHWPSSGQERFLDTWDAMEELVGRGAVRDIGVCNFTIDDVEDLLAWGSIPPAVNQIELNPRKPRAAWRAFAADHALATEAWGPLGRGGALLSHPLIGRLAADVGATPAQVVLAWHLAHGIVALPRSNDPVRCAQNLAAAEVHLPPGALAALDAIGSPRRAGTPPDPVERTS